MKLKTKLRFANALIILASSGLIIFLLFLITGFLKHSLTDQRFSTMVKMVNTQIDEDPGTDIQHLSNYISGIDKYFGVFAGIYDSNLRLITVRQADTTIERTIAFNPLIYPNVVQSFKTKNSEYLNVDFTDLNEKGQDEIHKTLLFYRAVVLDQRYIVVLASPFIEDTIVLPGSYYLIIYAIFVFAIFRISFLIVANTHNLQERTHGKKGN